VQHMPSQRERLEDKPVAVRNHRIHQADDGMRIVLAQMIVRAQKLKLKGTEVARY
jgi:hypothetical protein